MDAPVTREYLIWSMEHDAWWRPGEMGYTPVLREAGQYSETRARAIVQRANIVECHECMIPIEAVGLRERPDPPAPASDQLGNLLQWLAGVDPAYVRELEGHVRAHLANLIRR
jgi:hypothetical protein